MDAPVSRNINISTPDSNWIGFMVGDRKVFRVSDQGVVDIVMSQEELHEVWLNGPDTQAKMFAAVLMQLKALQRRLYGENHLLIAQDMRGLFGKLHRGHGETVL